MSQEFEQEDFDIDDEGDNTSVFSDEDPESDEEPVTDEESDLDIEPESPIQEDFEEKVSMNETDEDTDDEIEEKINVFDNSVKLHLLEQHNESKHSNFKEIQSAINYSYRFIS